MNKEPSAPSLFHDETDALILRILARNPYGLSADKIRASLPPSHRLPASQIAARLDRRLRQGHIHRWFPPALEGRKAPKAIYSGEPLAQVAERQIIEALRKGPLTPAQMKRLFPAHLAQHLRDLLEPLLQNRTIKLHPPLKGKRLLSLIDPDPLDYLQTEVKRLFEKARKLGFSPEAVAARLQGEWKTTPASGPTTPSSGPSHLEVAPAEAERIIFEAMTAIKPAAAHGALVYLPDLRRALVHVLPDKASFDRAVLHLASREKVQLQSHSLPADLTAEEKEAMIDNGRGSYFMAVGIRME